MKVLVQAGRHQNAGKHFSTESATPLPLEGKLSPRSSFKVYLSLLELSTRAAAISIVSNFFSKAHVLEGCSQTPLSRVILLQKHPGSSPRILMQFAAGKRPRDQDPPSLTIMQQGILLKRAVADPANRPLRAQTV